MITSLLVQSPGISRSGTLMLRQNNPSANKLLQLMRAVKKEFPLSLNLSIHQSSLPVRKVKQINSLSLHVVTAQSSWSGDLVGRTATSKWLSILKLQPHLPTESNTSFNLLPLNSCASIMRRPSSSMTSLTKAQYKRRRSLISKPQNSQCWLERPSKKQMLMATDGLILMKSNRCVNRLSDHLERTWLQSKRPNYLKRCSHGWTATIPAKWLSTSSRSVWCVPS